MALQYAGGVVMAGRPARHGRLDDRLAAHREGASRRTSYSAIGIAGTAGLALELVRLFQLELEHYEKIEGALLSLDGKANRLATMVRGGLGLAMQGLAVVPLFGGSGPERGARAGSSPTTSRVGATRRPTTTRSAPARCSPAGR